MFDIDYEAHSHYLDDSTSLEAASKVDISKQIKRVMYIYSAFSLLALSDFDLEKLSKRWNWNDSRSGLGSRRGTLVKAGLLKKVDRLGKTPRGNKCCRFQITNSGLKWVKENIKDVKELL